MSAPSAALYLRISLDRAGDGLGVERQRAACRTLARQRGWRIVEEYVDNSKSAYAKNVRRPSYDRMVEDFRQGRFENLVCWDLDRLTRQPRQLEDWIDAAEDRGLVVVTVDGGVDLGTESGRQFARIKAAVARGEVEHKSKRQRAANDQRAEQGLPFMGRRAFGYMNGGNETVKEEALELRRAVEELLAGSSLRAIARRLSERGVTTTAGNPWKPTELRRLLMNPRYAGLRVHRGEVVGNGSWPAIIDEDTHLAVVALLSDPSRRSGRGRPRAYLLSGVARCHSCGQRLYGRVERRGPIYVCEGGPHMGRKIQPVDEFVSAVMVGRLSRPDAADLFAATDHSEQVAELQAEARSLRARLDALAEAFSAGEIDRLQLAAGTQRLRSRFDTVAADLSSLLSAPTTVPLLKADDVAAAWAALAVEDRRVVIDSLADVVVSPPGRGARRFDPDTVQVLWKS